MHNTENGEIKATVRTHRPGAYVLVDVETQQVWVLDALDEHGMWVTAGHDHKIAAMQAITRRL